MLTENTFKNSSFSLFVFRLSYTCPYKVLFLGRVYTVKNSTHWCYSTLLLLLLRSIRGINRLTSPWLSCTCSACLNYTFWIPLTGWSKKKKKSQHDLSPPKAKESSEQTELTLLWRCYSVGVLAHSSTHPSPGITWDTNQLCAMANQGHGVLSWEKASLCPLGLAATDVLWACQVQQPWPLTSDFFYFI